MRDESFELAQSTSLRQLLDFLTSTTEIFGNAEMKSIISRVKDMGKRGATLLLLSLARRS